MVTPPTANFIITSNVCLPAGCGPDFPLEQQMLLSRPFRIAQQAWNQILHSGALPMSVPFPQQPHSTCIYSAPHLCLQTTQSHRAFFEAYVRSVEHLHLFLLFSVKDLSFNRPRGNSILSCFRNWQRWSHSGISGQVAPGKNGKCDFWCVMPSFTNIWLFICTANGTARGKCYYNKGNRTRLF